MAENSEPTAATNSQSHASRTVLNVVSNWGGFTLSGLVNFALAPFVVRHLGNTYYGITVLLLSLTGYLGLLDLGVRGATTRYIARFHSQSDHDSSGRFVSSALILFLMTGGLAVLVCLGLGIFAGALPIPRADLHWAGILIALIGPNIAVSLISGVFSGIPMALQRFLPVNVVGLLTTTLRAIAIVLALSAGGGLIAVATIQLASTVAATLAIVGVTRKLYPELQVRWSGLDREHVRLVLSFSVFSFTLLVFDTVIIYMNSVIVGIFLSASLVTFFAIGSNLVNYARAIVGGISKTSTPQASALEARGDTRGLQDALVNGAAFASIVTLPIAVTFLIRGKEFINLWMGAEYAGLSGRVLGILTLGLIFSACNQVTLATVLGVSKHKPLVPVFLVQALCNMILSIVLIHRWGLVGVAWATTLPYLAMSFFFWPRYLQRTLGVSVREYLWNVWVRTILAAAPFAGVTWMVEKYWPAPNLILFFFQTALALPVALICFWYFCLSLTERHALLPVLVHPAARILGLRAKRGSAPVQ